jgi:transketolase
MINNMDVSNLEKITKLIRYYSVTASTTAGSGHPTSSLSATDLMATLMFGGFFRYDLDNPKHPNNDRLIFSKGHASPLFYSLYAVAGALPLEDIKTYRQFDSVLEGHPTPRFKFTEASTGSLGQGLSIGVGMALNAKYVDKLPYNTFVLMGDSEMAEGSVWEAMASASHYKLDNLIAFSDVNRLGQRGETMYGHDMDVYKKRAEAFGWEAIIVDGHNIEEIGSALEKALAVKDKPTIILGKTLKGKGISFIEDKDGWHGKALKDEDYKKAIEEWGDIDMEVRGTVEKPEDLEPAAPNSLDPQSMQEYTEPIATRKAYGNALKRLYASHPEMVVLDAEVSNSTFSEIFKEDHADRFFEMFIAEQNMAGVAIGFAKRGKLPFFSSFAAFLSRCHDQIRMSRYSDVHMVVNGSHAGVSIGEDGASQMALEDLAMVRPILGSVVLYPSDAISTERLVEAAASQEYLVYIRTTRMDTPILYKPDEEFPVGGSKVLRESSEDAFTVVGAGITLHEALKAYDELEKQGTKIRVIDLYSVKPVDRDTLIKAAKETKALITVEDHYPEGGIGEAVSGALSDTGAVVHRLAVRKMPRSGKPQELLDYEEISAEAIVKKITSLL